MTDEGERGARSRGRETETETIARKSRQLEAARKRTTSSPWRGLGMFGLVGWSVAVPLVAGIALGIWMDRHWPGTVSWTLTLLVAGAALGALNAWFWVQREGRDD